MVSWAKKRHVTTVVKNDWFLKERNPSIAVTDWKSVLRMLFMCIFKFTIEWTPGEVNIFQAAQNACRKDIRQNMWINIMCDDNIMCDNDNASCEFIQDVKRNSQHSYIWQRKNLCFSDWKIFRIVLKQWEYIKEFQAYFSQCKIYVNHILWGIFKGYILESKIHKMNCKHY